MPKDRDSQPAGIGRFQKRLIEEAVESSVTNYLEATLLALWEKGDSTDGKEKAKKK